MNVKNALTINVDMDGVIADFTFAARSAALRILGKGYGPPVVFSLKDSWGLSTEENQLLWNTLLDEDCFRFLPPLEGLENVRRLVAAGHNVRIVTACTFRSDHHTLMARQAKLDWLSFHGLGAVPTIFSSGNKVQFPAAVAIDDKAPCDGWARPGALNLLLATTYNEHGYEVPGAFVHRVEWPDIMAAIYQTSLDTRLGRL